MSFPSPGDDHTHSVTRLIQQLRQDDPEAAGRIWHRYFERLLPLARAKLKGLSHRAVDEEDLLVSVFDRFFEAAKGNRFAKLNDRDDLWQILLLLTDRKASDEYRAAGAQKRGAGAPTLDAQGLAIELSATADTEPGPEFVAMFNENLSRALDRLGETINREVAILRMEGYENNEIADRLGVSLSTVERKLRVIREIWQNEFSLNRTPGERDI